MLCGLIGMSRTFEDGFLSSVGDVGSNPTTTSNNLKTKVMWVETKLVMDGGYQEVIIQPNDTQDAIVLNVVETQDDTLNSRLYLSYDEALRLASELIDFVNKNK